MSDSEHEEIVDNAYNDSVDWEEAVDLPGPPLSGNKGLSTILEESYATSVANRLKSTATSVHVPVDKNASRSFSDECPLQSSFGAPNMTSNSADFCGNVDNVYKMMDDEEQALERSGRRLEIPANFNASHCKGQQNCSWDKGPHQWTQKSETSPSSQPGTSTATMSAPIAPSSMKEAVPPMSQQPERQKSDMDRTQKTSPKTTSANHRIFEEMLTPVRKRHERVATLRETNSPVPVPQSTTTTSTPIQDRVTSRLPEWELSVIGANNTTVPALNNSTLNNTTGVSIPADQFNDLVKQMPLNANPSDFFAQLENIRQASLHKRSKREESRIEFRNSTAVTKKDDHKTTTLLQRNSPAERRAPQDSIRRLSTVEEERLDQSRTSMDTVDVGYPHHQRSQDPTMQTALYQSTDPISRPVSQASQITRPSSIASTHRSENSVSSSSGPLKIDGTTGKLLAFGPVAMNMELVKTLIITNTSDRSLRLEATLKKDIGYTILEGRHLQLLRGESGQLRIQFKPTQNMHRHNCALVIQCTNGVRYTIMMRAMAGNASVRLLQNENLQLSSRGVYMCKTNVLQGNYNFTLKNDGSPSYCKVEVLMNGHPVHSHISPSRFFVIKPNQKLDVTIAIGRNDVEAARQHALPEDGSLFLGVDIRFAWGDNYFRQRAMELLRRTHREQTEAAESIPTFSIKEIYHNEKVFKEPEDYTVNPSDLTIFESGICQHVVKIISAERQPSSLTAKNDIDLTLKPDDTMSMLRYGNRDRTLVRDSVNDTTLAP